jgi:hypothetical protein
MAAVLRGLGSQAGNAAVAAALAPQVQRLGKGGQRALARRMLARPLEIEVTNLTLVLDLFGRLAARRLVAWARPVLASKETSVEVAAYLSDMSARPDALTWALSVRPGDPEGLRSLLAIVLDHPGVDEVRWAWTLGGADPDATEQILAYMDGFKASGDHVVALAKKAVEHSAGDVQAATAEMVSLARYDHNPDLRSWAAGQAIVLGGEEVDARKAAAKTTRTTTVAGLVERPHQGRKLSKQKTEENTEAKAAYDLATTAADVTERTEIADAEAARAGLVTGKQTAMESFLQDCRTAKVSPADSGWLLKAAEGRTDLATALQPLFGPGVADPMGAATWVLGAAEKKALTARRLTTGLLEAFAAGLDLLGAQRLVGLTGWLGLDAVATGALAAAVGAKLAELDRTVLWLTSAPSLPDAIRALTKWVAKAGSLTDLLDFAATKPDLGQLSWFVDRVGATASKGALSALATLRIHGVPDPELNRLLAKASPADAESLLHRISPEKGKIDPQLLALLPKATGPQLVSLLVTHNHGLHHVHKWLVERKLAAADIDRLGAWAPNNILPFLLEGDSPASLLPLMGHAPSHLFELKTLALVEKSVAMCEPSLGIVAGASTVKAAWDKGSFKDPLHSVVYHYCKHVRDQSRAETVAQYSADAQALWANHSAQAFPWNEGWKIQRPHRTGTYATSGKPYSFWY